MKTKLMFAALAAAAVFTACNKENPVQEPVQPVNKSVVLNLANVMPSTKAEGTTIADGTQVQLNNYQVFFADAAGTLHTPKTETAVEGAETYFSFTDANVDPDVVKQFHFLPQSVKEVIVVGNFGSKITAATKTELMNQVKTLDIATQQNPSALKLYGIDESLTAMPANTNHTQVGQDVHPEPLFKAEINLHPAVARFEVTGFQYNELNGVRNFETMTINNLSMIHWYNTATVSIAEDTVVGETFVSGLTVGVQGPDTYFSGYYNDDTMYPQYLQLIKKDVAAMEEQPWYFDYIEETMPANYVLTAEAAIEKNGACWAYHVFPGALPRFIAELTAVNEVGRIEATETEEAVAGTPVTTKLYLQTIALGNLTDTTVEPGNIYRMNFIFDDSVLEQAEKCIQVEITVDKWNVVPVIPVFGKNPTTPTTPTTPETPAE